MRTALLYVKNCCETPHPESARISTAVSVQTLPTPSILAYPSSRTPPHSVPFSRGFCVHLPPHQNFASSPTMTHSTVISLLFLSFLLLASRAHALDVLKLQDLVDDLQKTIHSYKDNMKTLTDNIASELRSATPGSSYESEQNRLSELVHNLRSIEKSKMRHITLLGHDIYDAMQSLREAHFLHQSQSIDNAAPLNVNSINRENDIMPTLDGQNGGFGSMQAQSPPPFNPQGQGGFGGAQAQPFNPAGFPSNQGFGSPSQSQQGGFGGAQAQPFNPAGFPSDQGFGSPSQSQQGGFGTPPSFGFQSNDDDFESVARSLGYEQ